MMKSQPALAQLQLCLLGPAQLAVDGETLRLPYDKVLALLVYLAVECGHAHHRATLAGLLWPEQPEAAARHSLSQALFSLRRELPANAGEALVRAARDTVQLAPDANMCLDIAEFRRLFQAGASDARALEQAVALYRGAFLATLPLNVSAEFEEWALLMREQLHHQACDALERLTVPARWANDAELACRYARRWVELDPFSEAACRRLMGLLAHTGQRAAALAQYERCRALLGAELGVEPEAETTALYATLRHSPALERVPTAPALAAQIPHTRMIDREHELRALAGLLAAAPTRLVTILGPGGVGKTRLALHAATANAQHFRDGVVLVSLAPLREPALVLAAVAQALGVQQGDARSLHEQVLAALAPRHMLVLLDNCEHVLAAVATLAAELLIAAPRLTILATSRSPLHLLSERRFLLAPLRLPEAGAPTDRLAEAPAVALFIERAQAARTTVTLDLEAISAICRRLDGLPLAIELAATRTRLLEPPELLARLAQRLPLLTGGPRDVPERQQTLRAAIDWSYQLLAPHEQALLRRLAVFAGGWTIAAAEAVCADESAAAQIGGEAIVDGLTALLDASLIMPLANETPEPRWTMLETIREYAYERLAAGAELAVIQARHARHMVALADAAKTAVIGPEGARWSRCLAAEHDNVRAALRWALDAGEYETVLRVGRGVWRFWWRSGFAREGLQWLEAALGREPGRDAHIRAEALRAAGVLAWSIDDFTQARRWLAHGLALAQQLPDRQPEAAIHTMLGILTRSEGNFEQAREHFVQSRHHSATLGDQTATRFAIMGLGEIALRLGNLDAAAEHFTTCVVLNGTAGDAEGVAAAKRRLAYAYCLQGREHATAQALCEESQLLCQEVDDKQGLSQTLLVLGELALLRGEFTLALAHFRQSLQLRKQLEKHEDCAQSLEALARGLVHTGFFELAIQLMGAAHTVRAGARAALTDFERGRLETALDAARAARGASAFQRWLAQGQALTLEQAVTLALR